ncbi:PREDICTED: probable pectinesterase/pectinesterase inhibitor 17 [Tarenaya hassleriana]|uniref:probable pectinesterase/pectinesterase inhibitor 17 n=1 Tax=Tarenaya hassleriana TaxID=28532 RepID=UPI00053C66B7|nr:PREDICTED: probable pectinesterase/pectinesterase inhibitor 17 [Tarenaya hassleriana]
MAIRAYVTIFLFCVFLGPTVFAFDSRDVKSWCSKTPNPTPCEYFLTYDPNHQPIKSESEFLKISVKLALDRAMLAKNHAFTLGPKCRDSREKTAWEDCLKLYDYTVSKLNETIDPHVKCSKVDAQTWLSSALTNLETCRTGFIELGVPDFLLPLMSNNVSKLISNTLAINEVPFNYTPPSENGFPEWVRPGDRKLLQSSTPQANAVVAQDGSGNFRTIKEAVDSASKRSGSGRFVIYVKQGVYNENIEIKAKNIMLRGDGIGKTIITGSKSVGGGATTFNSATVAVVGDGFIARGITFRNTAGPSNGQAVALRSGSDLSVFYQCSFEGYQDTLYVHSNRQFYRECDIYGTVDFIFGNAAAVFQNCNIFARRPRNKTNTVTAQGRSDPNQNTGIVIHNSRVTAGSDLQPVLGSVKTYLGRPWRQYSRTVFMKTFLDGLIDPRGWLEWNGNFALSTLFYAEYQNTGPGSSTSGRVTWPGFRVLTAASDASRFTVGSFIAGNSWIPATNVPFTSGL